MEKFTSRIIPVSQLEEKELLAQLRENGISLTLEEVKKIRDILGRDPSVVELHVYNVEWSEHCSYKSSKKVLKKYLPTSAPHVILGPGEDAGIVYLATVNGEKYGLVIAHESHNHPSQVLPVEGAATGIGGIVRDVNCMGAEVIAVADGLRFGDPEGKFKERSRWIAQGVVQGIWEYANALGVPNIGGDVYFNSSFDDNCLVNVVALGVVKEKNIIHSRIPEEAKEIPYDLILVGKPTDASGFGGAAFASEILDEEKEEEKKGAVQVHDPFLKNVLLLKKANTQVFQEAEKRGYKIGFKDLGAAGIAGASSELGASGGMGVEIDLDKVHVAMEGLLPEVILCAETQERYMLAVPREFTPEVLRIYNEIWELPHIYEGAQAKVIGRAIPEKRYRVKFKGEIVCDIPIQSISEGIVYERKATPPKRDFREPVYSSCDLEEAVKKVISSPNVCSREYIYRFYDTEVQGKAVIRPGEADAGVMAPVEEEGSSVGIAFSLDGNPFYGRIDPYWGGANAVAESMRNVACVGAVPWCLTDCLNFGNPEKPEAFYDFVESVKGMSDAAKYLWLKGSPGTPVPIVSGNVSFYNESASGRAIDPSPIVACVGIMDDYSKAITMHLKETEDPIYLIGKRYDELGGSEFYLRVLGEIGKNVPQVRWEEERNAIYVVIDLIRKGIIVACHDISEGGMITSIIEMLISRRGSLCRGAVIDIDGIEEDLPVEKILFTQSAGFIAEVVNEKEFKKIAGRYGIYYKKIGVVISEPRIEVRKGEKSLINLSLNELKELWASALSNLLS